MGMLRADTVLLLMCTLPVSCTQPNKEAVIARVGSDELTRREALAHIDTVRGSREQQLGAYVASWIDAELIYHEAARMNMDRPEGIDDRLRDFKRQLVNQLFLDRLVYNETPEIADHPLREYLDSHQKEFEMREDMVKLRFVIFKERERAAEFISRVARASNWDGVLRDTLLSREITSSTTARYYSQHTLYPSELWKIVFTLGLNDLSFPVK